MNPGTLSIVLLAVIGLGLTGLAAWLERRFRESPEHQDRTPD